MTPALSVVIPTFGRRESVIRALAALRAQTLREIEVIVVDQNAPGFLDDLGATSDVHVHHVRLPQPNASAARNLGFSLARAELILFLDDDLVPEPDFLARAVAVAEQHPEIGSITSVAYGADGPDAAIANMKTLATGRTLAGSTLFEITESRSDAMLFRRDYFRRTGGFDEVLFAFARTAEDQELCIRMRKRGLRIWMDTSLRIFHDDNVAGGCELRTSPYWTVRERCMNAWAFRYRAHGGRSGKLTLWDSLRLLRSAALNRGALRSGPRDFLHQVQLLGSAVVASKRCIDSRRELYANVDSIDHLRPYRANVAQPGSLTSDTKSW